MIKQTSSLGAQISETLECLRAISGHGARARLAKLSGVNESTLRQMARKDYLPRPIDNLVRVHAGLAALSAEFSNNSAVAAGVGAQAQPAGEAGDVEAGEGACAHAPTLPQGGAFCASKAVQKIGEGDDAL
jgi:hypothetical protein